MTPPPSTEKPVHKPFARPIQDILTDLARPIPARFLKQREQGGKKIPFLPWKNAIKLLDYYAPGWQGEITHLHCTTDRIFLTYRLSIHAAEGVFSREATGTETLKEQYFDREAGVYKVREIAYGDPSSNAESMAFRRAAAKFGLALMLYG